MPKKRPNNRLDDLFENIEQEETTPSQAPEKSSRDIGKKRPSARSAKQASKAGGRSPALAPTNALPSLDTLTISQPATQTSPATMSLGLQLDEKNWATLQVVDEGNYRTWDENDELLVRQVTDQLTQALENARLFQETRSRAEELAILNEMGRELTTLLDVEAIAASVYKHTSRLMDTANLFIALYDEKKQEINPFFVINNHERVQAPPRKLGNALSDHILRTRESLFIPEDVPGHMKRIGLEVVYLGNTNPAQCWLGCPLLTGDAVIGVIGVQSVTTPNLYTEHHRDILTAVAGRAAIAIENARLFAETQRRAEELAVLNQLAQRLSARLDVNQVLQEIYAGVSRLLDAKNFYIGLYDPEKDVVNFPLNVSESVIDRSVVTIKANEGMTGHILQSRAPLLVEDNLEAVLKSLGIEQVGELARSWLGVPLMLGSQVTGVMAVQSYTQANAYNEHDLDLLVAFAGQAAISIQNARLFEETVHSQEALARSEGELRALFHAMTDVIIVYDREGRYVRVAPTNPSRLFRPPEEMLGKKISEVLPERLHKPFMEAIQRALENNRLERVEYSLDIEGQEYWFEGNISKLSEDQVFWVARDITERRKAEEDILKFKLGIDQSSDAVFITDTGGNITYVNPGFEKIYGYSAEEAVGKNPRIIKSGLLNQEVYKNFWATLLSKQTASGEIINRHKNGNLVNIAGTNSPILDEKGEILGFLAVHHDITSLKQAEENLKRRNEYLAATADIGQLVTSTLDMPTLLNRTVNLVGERFNFAYAGIFIIEETGFNAILDAATGQAGEQMKREHFSLPVGSKSAVGEVTSTGKSVVINDASESEIFQFNPLLPETRAEAVIPLRVGSRVIGVLDIQSNRVDTFSEDDIAVLQTLADQVAIAIDNARSYELSIQAVKEMREADRLKSQFLANMSHELRTPLNSIIGFSRVILKGIDGPITELQQQDLLAIHNSGQHLLGLINDILDLSRIEAGKMELAFDEVHLPELVSSVMSTAAGLVKDKNIQLQKQLPEELPTVRADAMRVRQVLLNLLSNAAKFTDEGTITVFASLNELPNGRSEVVISVTDTGPGISKEDQKKLFQPFSQVDASPTRKTGGSGLGLSISNHLIQMHGGRMGVESDTGQGSTFFFSLPLFHERGHAKGEAGNRTILAIDDDPQVINLYDRYLQPQGYQVVSLHDPSRSVERARQLKPFAITLDIMMPGYDGWHVLNDLKADPETRDIPVIVCSIVEEQEKGFSLGAADYLLKPILEEDIVGALDRLNGDGSIREVLVIDDDPHALRLIDKMLSEHGRYRPIMAEGGQNGWEAIKARPPHAVILDLFMPDLDGFTILERMRSDQSLRDIPVVVVSGGELTKEQNQQLQEFGQRMIQKGALTEGELLNTLEHVLKRVHD